MPKQTTKKQPLWQRYLLTGAALGLYFGLFFRPLREPSLGLAVLLGAVAALVTTLLPLFRGERPSFTTFLKTLAGHFFKYTLLLAVLELRHPVHDWGGRTAVSAMTTLMGAVGGLWLAWEQDSKRLSVSSKQ